MGLYTCDELTDKLKAIDLLLDDATTRSSLDTGQSKQDFTQSIRTLREQYEKYLSMLQVQCPETYRQIVGASVIKYGRGICQY